MDPISSSVESGIASAVTRLGLARARLLVAVSGGVDSSVLLDALSRASGPFEIALDVAHINHGLRGEASEQDQKAVEAQASALGLACHVRCVDVEGARVGHASRTRPTRQEAARILRREALEDIARTIGTPRIATAHHLDDQAETVLMRVLRGSAGDGLAGIPEVSYGGSIVRPLLRVSRRAIEDYAREHRISWREDLSNRDDRYARNRLRGEVIPMLSQAFNPQLPRALANLARSQRLDAEWIGSAVDREFALRFRESEDSGFEIVKAGWSELHEALATRLVVKALEALGAGRDQTRLHVERALDFLSQGSGAEGGREIELPGGLRLKRARKKFFLYRVHSQ